jgi:hypothetical protein
MLLTLEEMHHETAISSQHKKHLNTALCWNSSLLPRHLETGPTNRSNSVTVQKYIITSMAYEQKVGQNRKADGKCEKVRTLVKSACVKK